jgi:hypothetical protein
VRTTHYLPVKGTYLYLVKELFRELGIDNGSRLYSLPLRQAYPTVVFSPIPPNLWDQAHKLVVYLSGEIGRLSAAAEVLSEMKINLITSAAAATTATGEVCWSSTIELPKELMAKGLEACLSEISEKLRKTGALSRSPEFDSGLDRIILHPLRVLQSLKVLTDESNQYVGTVENFALDMRSFRDPHGNSLFRSIIIEPYIQSRLPAPNYCLITPDTEEKYFRLTFLPYQTKLMEVSMEMNVASTTNNFQGFFGATLHCLSGLGFNIYAANNLLLSKTPNSHPAEAARFVFTVDASKAKLSRDSSKIRSQVHRKVLKALKEHAKELPKTKIDISNRGFRVKPIEETFPRCFLATNATPDDLTTLEFAQKLLTRLRSLKLEPVNVDITKSRTVYEDVASLLRASALVVSLHLPTKATQIMHPDKTLGERVGHYNPPDWVLFEESFALALGRRILRLRHDEVRQPRYAHGEREFVFKDAFVFERQLDAVSRAIDAEKNSIRFLQAVAQGEAAASRVPESLLRRNLEREYKLIPDLEVDTMLEWTFRSLQVDSEVEEGLAESIRAVFLDGFGLSDGWTVDEIKVSLRRSHILGLLMSPDGQIWGYAFYSVPPNSFEGRWFLWEDAICLRKNVHGYGLSEEALPYVQRLYPRKEFGWIGGRTQNPIVMRRYAAYGKVFPFDLRYDEGVGPRLMEFIVGSIEEIGAVADLDRATGICRQVYKEGILGDYLLGLEEAQPFERLLNSWNFNRAKGDAVIVVAAIDERR